MQSSVITFQSSDFFIGQDEDQETNPGVYGKSLAQWLSSKLIKKGVAPCDVIAEDFGWCISVNHNPHVLYIVCADEEGSTDQWRIFVFAEGGVLQRLLGKDTRKEKADQLLMTLQHMLQLETDLIKNIEVH